MTQFMHMFKSCSSLRTLSQIHAHFFITGLHRDRLASTKLIESYATMGDLQTATLAFQRFPDPDSFMYGILIKCYVWNGLFTEAIETYNRMLNNNIYINTFIFPSVLRACAGISDLIMGQRIHGKIIKRVFESNSVVETSLLSMYGEIGCLSAARKVFDEMSTRDVVSWTSLISSYVQNDKPEEGLSIFRSMIHQCTEAIESVTMLAVAEACCQLGFLRSAKSVHGYVTRKEIHGHTQLDTSLMNMYGKCGDLQSAETFFNKSVHRKNTSSWTVKITCFYNNGCYEEALNAFVEMQEAHILANEVTMLIVLCSCARLGFLMKGKSAHCFLIRNHIDTGYDLLGQALVDLYSNCGKVSYCLCFFDSSKEKNMVIWNLMIWAYTQEFRQIEAFKLFGTMQSEGLSPDPFTFSSVLTAVGDICWVEFGYQIHTLIIKIGISFSNEYVVNSLIDMYSHCGLVPSAYKVFDESPLNNVTTWNTMISGFSRNGNSKEAVNLFERMLKNHVEIDEVSLLTAIQACSSLGSSKKGKWVHHKLIVYGLSTDIYMDTTLIDMYAKCGELQVAQAIFERMNERTVATWTAIISAYGAHGEINSAIFLFDEMIKSGIKPNEKTFMSILSACSHSGYVEEGKRYFNSMVEDFAIEPTINHFSCMVDLLSRAGDIDGAYRIIRTMPHAPVASVWGALLNGCRIHGRMEEMESFMRRLGEVETDDSGYYTLLSNIYAQREDWEKCRMVRLVMKESGLSKVHGYSLVEN
ncbi:putative pentatricopeptide repeat-containing protein At1g69350, mitochondrial [Impatiens glandulifera]|uniref:putative pentatricopeptide repeat-containing protein At1g69350, mitochondrial n=1 Tax=Impatiens glandulifera TaxID=253017 RepID=UPI001FB0E3EF|nr:putative pentatricopeptide repeat-containing protein At1g69350, mitochondrial [Impatiens glandulifera]